MARVTIDGAGKVFPDGTVAVHRVDLDIDDGELLAIVGASGCGKTTVLRMVAGFEDPSWGNIRFDGEIVDRVRVQQRGLAMLFQECAVYPHLDVAANLGFPLKMAGVHHREIARRVDDVAHRLGIADTLDRRPSRLSGGERQRVALGRAIIRDPSILLMDEPMSNVDAKLRTELRTQLTVLQRQLGVTTLLVTHDQVEALSMGHRVAVMRAGEVVQCATPRDLYEAPADVGVATFVGSPPMNVLAGVVDRSAADGDAVRIGAQSIPFDTSASGSDPRTSASATTAGSPSRSSAPSTSVHTTWSTSRSLRPGSRRSTTSPTSHRRRVPSCGRPCRRTPRPTRGAPSTWRSNRHASSCSTSRPAVACPGSTQRGPTPTRPGRRCGGCLLRGRRRRARS